MPPKVVKKEKATVKDGKAAAEPTTSKKAASSTPRKVKQPTEFKALSQVGDNPVRIDVKHEGSAESKMSKDGVFTHQLKLEGSNPFTVLNTYTITHGQNEGQQVIVLQPAKAFPFSKLPQEARKRVCVFYFAHSGIINEAITIEGKRKGNGELFAKAYADGSKFRVALLVVDRETHQIALPVLYAIPMRLESTSNLLTFLGSLTNAQKKLLRHLEIKQYIKSSARNAMAFLSEADNLTYLEIETGVITENEPGKAAKAFWLDAYKLLGAVGTAIEKQSASDTTGVKAKKPDAVDILHFGKQALLKKDDKKGNVAWSEGERKVFLDSLKAKLSP